MKFLIFVFVFLFIAAPVEAALVTITPDGRIVNNVLSAENVRSEISIKKVSAVETAPSASVLLTRSDGKVQVIVDDAGVERTRDVTSFSDTVIELVETSPPKTVDISVNDEGFVLAQGGIEAVTIFPIKVDARGRTIAVETPVGSHNINVLPADAFTSLVNARIVTVNLGMAIAQGENGELLYQVAGERVVDVLGFFDISVPVVARVSAVTGRLLEIDQPAWARVMSFLFV